MTLTPDHNPIIGPAPETADLYLANGFSGHSFQQGTIVGKLLVELIVHSMASSVDISALAPERFSDDQLVKEKNVV